MAKDFIVIFNEDNARIEKHPDIIEKLKNNPNVILNPSLDKVSGIPPHFWKLEAGQIVQMNDDEKEARRLAHARKVIDTRNKTTKKDLADRKALNRKLLIKLGLALALGFILGLLV